MIAIIKITGLKQDILYFLEKAVMNQMQNYINANQIKNNDKTIFTLNTI